jgi:hypothetical protein
MERRWKFGNPDNGSSALQWERQYMCSEFFHTRIHQKMGLS